MAGWLSCDLVWWLGDATIVLVPRHLQIGFAVNWPLWPMIVAGLALTAACTSNQQNVADGADVSGFAESTDLEMSVRSIIDPVGLPAAVLVVDNDSGIIVDSVVVGETVSAPVGGGLRPAGSVMKVLVLAAAIEFGTKPDDILEVPDVYRNAGAENMHFGFQAITQSLKRSRHPSIQRSYCCRTGYPRA